AHAQIVRFADGAHRIQDFLKDALARRASGDHETERARFESCGAARRREDLLAREQRIFLDLGGRHRGLRAIVAIFGTQSALRIEQEVQPDAILPVVASHAIRGGQLGDELVVWRAKHGARILSPNDLAGERRRRQAIPIAGVVLEHHRFGCPSSMCWSCAARASRSRNPAAAAARARAVWSVDAGSHGKLTTGVPGSNVWMVSWLVRRARSGSSPSVSFNTTPSTATAPCWSARTVSSVWLTAPRRLAATTTASSDQRRQSDRYVSVNVIGTSRPPAPSTRMASAPAARRANDASSDATESTRFARRAAIQGASGSSRAMGQ